MTLKDKATGEVKLVKAVRPISFLHFIALSTSAFHHRYKHVPFIARRRTNRVSPFRVSFRHDSAFTTLCCWFN